MKQNRKYQRGEDRWNARLTPSEVREIRRLSSTTKNASLAAKFGVHESNIEHIINRRTWKHVA